MGLEMSCNWAFTWAAREEPNMHVTVDGEEACKRPHLHFFHARTEQLEVPTGASGASAWHCCCHRHHGCCCCHRHHSHYQRSCCRLFLSHVAAPLSLSRCYSFFSTHAATPLSKLTLLLLFLNSRCCSSFSLTLLLLFLSHTAAPLSLSRCCSSFSLTLLLLFLNSRCCSSFQTHAAEAVIEEIRMTDFNTFDEDLGVVGSGGDSDASAREDGLFWKNIPEFSHWDQFLWNSMPGSRFSVAHRRNADEGRYGRVI